MTLCDLYDADYLHSHIYPVAKELMKDRVHEVRQAATQLVSIYNKYPLSSYITNTPTLFSYIIAKDTFERENFSNSVALTKFLPSGAHDSFKA